jgi:hypothetical protein
MSRDLLDEATRALRRQTAEVDDDAARATRRRIMGSLHSSQRQRRSRLALLLPIAAVLVGSTAFAAGGGKLDWQTVTSALGIRAGSKPSDGAEPPTSNKPQLRRAFVAAREIRRTAPIAEPPRPFEPPAPEPELAESKAAPAKPAAEARVAEPDPSLELYRVAHRLHFSGGDAAAALSAWDRYLAEAARGRFALEARYNRAICLVRLGRGAEARSALEPFARGAYGQYRRASAQSLLDAMGDQ